MRFFDVQFWESIIAFSRHATPAGRVNFLFANSKRIRKVPLAESIMGSMIVISALCRLLTGTGRTTIVCLNYLVIAIRVTGFVVIICDFKNDLVDIRSLFI